MSKPEIIRVVRTETIEYVKDYTRKELIDLGVEPEVFENDWTADLAREIEVNDSLHDFLVEDTERYADVQGSSFRFRSI